MAQANAILTAQELTKTLGERELLQELSFWVLEGARVGIIGRNGEGKSTFARILAGQVGLGLLLGIVCGLVLGGAALVLAKENGVLIGLAVAASMTALLTVSAATGTILPIVCERLGIDPAVAAGPFITTMNDVVGLLIYFSVATLILLSAAP